MFWHHVSNIFPILLGINVPIPMCRASHFHLCVTIPTFVQCFGHHIFGYLHVMMAHVMMLWSPPIITHVSLERKKLPSKWIQGTARMAEAEAEAARMELDWSSPG